MAQVYLQDEQEEQIRLNMPQNVIIKRYAIVSAGRYIAPHGRNCLVIAGKHFLESEDSEIFFSSLTLKSVDFETEEYAGGEPEVSSVDGIVGRHRGGRFDCVVGIGGGSVIDTAKAVSGMLANDGGVEQYLELPGREIMRNSPLPFIAIPTTAGTGAEATKNAVIKNGALRYKKSFRDERLTARCVIIDAPLYTGAPGEVTAFSGMDALTQLVEAFTSNYANGRTDEFCRQGFRHIRYLAAAYSDPGNISAREETALAAYKSGVAISNAGAGAVHALASPIGAHTGLAHGLICGILLPRIMEINKPYALKKYAEIGRLITGNSDSDDEIMAEAAIAAVGSLARALKIPMSFHDERLNKLSAAIVGECINGGSMRSNPAAFDEEFWKAFVVEMSK
ncbi:MAG: iron-containing alcohol dehydrogenase [Clostridiales bacterium]|jgi:alcohol dehydrogenase class IV|nr:iron-containing alcohol dehydrogenase [Clostridiales bacterium]